MVAGTDAGLRPRGEPVAEDAEQRSDGQFEHELMREQAELGSAPHTDLDSLDDELRRRRAELACSAAEHGVRLVAAGTSPVDSASSTTAAERYRRMTELFGDTARSALSCGMHVHVSVGSRAEGVAALNGVRAWLPVLLALSANSPFHAGRDTGHQSYRSVLWQQWPSAGPFGAFADESDYDATVAMLVDSGAAIDDAGLYFDARLSARYPTVEIRVADVCPRVEDAVTLAGLCRALVDAAVADALPAICTTGGRVEIVRAATWRAARFGLDDDLLQPSTGRLVPAWTLIDELADTLTRDGGADSSWCGGLASIERRGTGSRLQRDVHDRTGDLSAVVDALAELTVA